MTHRWWERGGGKRWVASGDHLQPLVAVLVLAGGGGGNCLQKPVAALAANLPMPSPCVACGWERSYINFWAQDTLLHIPFQFPESRKLTV